MFRIRYVILATFWWIHATVGDIIWNEDICGSHNGRRLYLELGERGILYARNVTFVRNSPRQLAPRFYVTANSSHHQCSLELVTCPSCVIVAIFKKIALSHHCGDGGVVMDNPCRCDYVWISEPPYEDVSGTPFCGSYAPITYRSSTRILSINLLYSQSHRHAFTIEYTAERNRLHLKSMEMTAAASTKGSNGTDGGILTSPFFPARYPRDLGLEYIITCPSDASSCRIRLLFSDFQLATVSIMEFYDWNGQRLDVSSGAKFRPPVIVSTGPSLLVRFYANGGSGLGYKAFYSYVIGHTFNKSVQPITDCGGYVENLGGAITMMNMVGQGAKTYDCVWLIRPPKNFLHMKTHMYLKVVGFADMAGNTELIIKQGPTSALMSLEIIRHPASQLQPPRYREHIAPVTSGFHVSLRGTFGPNSQLAIAYATFSYTNCFAGTDFLCQNHRCIPRQLNCDGFDHCGDNSDEPATCFQDWEMQHDRKWHMNKANYYFPKIDRYPDLKTATLVFVASSLGLIILISALIVLLYRIGARARQQRELQSRLETISGLLDGSRIEEISIQDDPPDYEAPPGYEEVVKLASPKKIRYFNRESCNGRSQNQHDENANSSAYLATEDASDCRGDRTTSISVSRNEQRLYVSGSPPPPYITPPGTISRNVIAGLSASMRQICSFHRTWTIRRSAQYPRSSSNDRSSANGPPTFIDAENLGIYSTRQAAVTNLRSAENFAKDSRIVRETNAESGANVFESNSRHVPEENYNGIDCRTADRSDGRNVNCSCEGACGCVIDNSNLQDVLMNVQSISIPTILTTGDDCDIPEATCDDTAINGPTTSSSSARKRDECEEEDLTVFKSAIVRLLGPKLIKPSSCCVSPDSSATSSPFDTPLRSIGKLSVCSRDSYITKISATSLCSNNSYEKLRNEFEIASKPANVSYTTSSSATANISSDTFGNVLGRRDRLHSSCDLNDCLCEAVGFFDSSPLMHKSLSVSRQSVSALLFGNPKYDCERDDATGSSQRRTKELRMRMRARLWRSTEDTLSSTILDRADGTETSRQLNTN